MWSICCRRLVDRSMVVAEPGGDGSTRYRLLETLRQYGEEALAADPTATATMRDRHLAHFLERAEHWYAQQRTADEPEANQAFAANWDNLRAAFDWALANGRGREVADLLHTTYLFACTPVGGSTASGPSPPARQGLIPGRSPAPPSCCGPLGRRHRRRDRRARHPRSRRAGLLARDVEKIWRARAVIAFMINDPDEIERAAAWLHEEEPRCTNPIIEAWLLANILDAHSLHPTRPSSPASSGSARRAPAPAFKRSPARRARPPLPEPLGDGLDLGDIVEGLQHAMACSRAAGNLFVEAICMTLAVIPLTDRGDPRDAAALRATLERIHDLRYDFALTSWRRGWPCGSSASAGTKPPASSTDGSAPTFPPHTP